MTIVSTLTEDIGGGDRTRTRYLLLAKQPLYQVSYTPNSHRNSVTRRKGLMGTSLQLGGSGWSRTNDPCVINTVL